MLNKMKVDYKNYPILKVLERGDLSHIKIYKDDIFPISVIKSTLFSEFKKSLPVFKREINVITQPFDDAAERASLSLMNLFEDVLKSDKLELDVQGTFISKSTVFMADISIHNGDYSNILIYTFDKSGNLLSAYSSKKDIIWASELFRNDIQNDEEGLQGFISISLQYVIIRQAFKSYANVETKTLQPHKRPREITCLYRNNTKLPITFLDSKWFTTLVKSEGFNVRGHFRLQPKKKDGKWTKELIWINEFRKTGYTAPARKLSYNNNN